MALGRIVLTKPLREADRSGPSVATKMSAARTSVPGDWAKL